MPVILTDELPENTYIPNAEWIYNGLDCAVTFEVWQQLQTLFDSEPETYVFERALQAPALEMMLRGFRVNDFERQRGIADLTAELDKLNTVLQSYAFAVWGKPLNPRSTKQLQEFFYGKMRLPEQMKNDKGTRRVSTDREALEKLEVYFHAMPIIATILAIRDRAKRLSVLQTEIDADMRMRTSYNIAGTETGRWSSSSNAFGTGCVLPTTEVLTPKGWRNIAEIISGDKIAQWEPGGKVSFVPCSIFVTEFSGNMLRLKTEQIQQTLTPGHRVPYMKSRLQTGLKVDHAAHVSKLSQCALPLGGMLQEDTLAYPAYLSMFMADFSREGTGWRGSFKKERKIARFLHLAKLYGFDYTEQKAREGYRHFYVPGQLHLPKTWGEWVLQLSQETAKALLEEARHWDAHDRGSGFIFFSADKQQAEWFATLAHIAGKSATIRYAEQNVGSYSTTSIWSVNVKARNHARVQRKHWTTVPYEGKVYCPSVPSTFWLMREGGYISVTGNTNLQNITPKLRKIFEADSGWKLCGIDLEQAESREVGWLCGTLFNDWRYLDACECLTADHEVLTQTGWVSISALPNKILTWKNGVSRFADVLKWHTGKSSELLTINNGQLDICGTLNHTMPVYTGKFGDKLEKRTLQNIQQHPNFRAPCTGVWEGGNVDVPHAALIAAFQADGTRDASGRVHFTFSKPRKIKLLQKLLDIAKIKYSTYFLANGVRFYLHAGQGQDVWPKFCGNEILTWTKASLIAFCQSHKFWDAHTDVSNTRIVAKNKDHLLWLGTAYTFIGKAVTINKHKKDYWILTIKTNKYTQYRSAKITKTVGEAVPVYCPTVEDGYFMVRRNNKIYISGNSGDLHTLTCKLIWKDLAWPGDKKGDRALADQVFYREFSRRDMSKRGGHGCLTADHEVLTPQGWVSISDKPDTIMAWSPSESDFAVVSHWEEKFWEKDLVQITGTSVDLLATPDHRVLYYADRRSPLKEAPAGNFPKIGSLPLGWGYVGGTTAITPELARLIAAFQSDGHQKTTNRVEFHFKKNRKFARLVMLAKAAGIVYEQNSHGKILLHASGWPKMAGAYMLDWSKAAICAFVDEYKHWDGHTGKTAVALFSKHKTQLEWIQTLGRLCGLGGNMQKPLVSGFGTTIHKLQQNSRKYASCESLLSRIGPGQTLVFCPTVPTGAFYVRRNGKISVTGNSNYLGTPFTMARHLKVPTRMMVDFQQSYFGAFPAIPQWHRWVAEQIQTVHHITTPFGRTRHFFGRPDDASTLREAVAYSPQSSTGDRMNLGLWRIWNHFGTSIRLTAQVHDAVYFQYRVADECEIVTKALELVEVELTHGARNFCIPGEAKIGWNWGNYSDTNPDGLIKYKGPGLDKRTRTPILDKRM